MKTKLIEIINEQPLEKLLLPAAQIIQQGALVAFPTETVYGLGANGLDAKAVKQIYKAKGRPSDNPLILHIADEAMVDILALNISVAARKLMKVFWPGPLTLVLKRRKIVPDQVTGGLETVGIRMPDHVVAHALIRQAGVPLAAPSANTSGRPSPTTAKAVLADLDGKVAAVIDGGTCRCGLESTIIDCSTEIPVVLRPGAITLAMIEPIIGTIELDPALVGAMAIPKAPGMKYTHYAPLAPMIVLEGDSGKVVSGLLHELDKAALAGKQAAVIVSEETAACLPEKIEKFVYGKRGNIRQIAANLYLALRSFDNKSVDIIFAEGTTEQGLGLAVMNRLHKACGFQIIKL